MDKVLQTFNELLGPVIRDVWLPSLIPIGFAIKDPREGVMLRALMPGDGVPSSKGIDGTRVKLPFQTAVPYSWRGMNARSGYLPTGYKFAFAQQYADLSCHAASAIASYQEIKDCQGNQNALGDILENSMKSLAQTLPYYIRSIFWSSKDALKAIGKVSAVAGTTITLDNAGLWLTDSGQITSLIEPDMWLQAYRGTVKLGAPFQVVSVNAAANQITIDVDPGLADNDVFVISDVAGLDVPYSNCCGILDVIDDDNTFQGLDRSLAANAKYRPLIVSNSGNDPDYAHLSAFFEMAKSPAKAYAHPALVRWYYEHEIAAKVNYTPGGTYKDGVQTVQVDNTTLIADTQIPKTRIMIPDPANVYPVGKPMENLFNAGWVPVPNRPIVEYNVAMWLQLLGEDCRPMATLHTIDLT